MKDSNKEMRDEFFNELKKIKEIWLEFFRKKIYWEENKNNLANHYGEESDEYKFFEVEAEEAEEKTAEYSLKIKELESNINSIDIDLTKKKTYEYSIAKIKKFSYSKLKQILIKHGCFDENERNSHENMIKKIIKTFEKSSDGKRIVIYW